MSKRHEYIAKMEQQLEKLNTQMGELEAKAQEAREAARSNYKEEMGRLRQKSKLAVAKLDELKAAGEDSWETMVNDMETMHDAFTHSFFSMFQIPPASSTPASAEKPAHKGRQAA